MYVKDLRCLLNALPDEMEILRFKAGIDNSENTKLTEVELDLREGKVVFFYGNQPISRIMLDEIDKEHPQQDDSDETTNAFAK